MIRMRQSYSKSPGTFYPSLPSAMLLPRSPAACPNERFVRRRWLRSPHTPCNQAGSGLRNLQSTQTQPVDKGDEESEFSVFLIIYL